MWVCSGSPVNAEICAGSGLDWLLIDMEHAANDLARVQVQLQVVSAYPITAVVRIPAADPVTIKQVLDLGAQTIMVPMVSSAEQAEATVAAAHYPPRGSRGVGSALARSARWDRIEDYLRQAGQHVSIVVQIETREGVAWAGEIAAVDGVDSVFVGPSDLAASMGLLGQPTAPEVVEAVRQTFRAVHSTGKPVGVNAFDPAVADRYLADGANFLLVASDVSLLARSTEELARRFPATPGRLAPEG